MSSRCLFRVSEVFTIRGRGTVLLPGIVPEGEERFGVGDLLELRFQDGRRVNVAVAGLQYPSENGAVPVLVKVGKEDVPVGTEVWSVPGEGKSAVDLAPAAGRGSNRVLKAVFVVVAYELMVLVMMGFSVWIYMHSPEVRGEAGLFVLLSAWAALLPLYSVWRSRWGRLVSGRKGGGAGG